MNIIKTITVTVIGTSVAALTMMAAFMTGEAYPHEWYPPNCCSGYDCAPIEMSDVQLTPEGFVIPGNPEVVPYSSPKVKRTPPEGANLYHLCTRAGKRDGEVLCLYIPNWGS
jgi:hypothetical protein